MKIETVTITRDDFDKLMWLAEQCLQIQSDEYSNDPDEEDRELMLAMWSKAGKEVPNFFAKNFGWKHSEDVMLT